MSTHRIEVDLDLHKLFDYMVEIDPTVSMADIEAFLELYLEGLQQAAIDAVNAALTESVRNWIDKRLIDKREPNLPELDDDNDDSDV